MDIVLGVSMAPSTVRMVLIEGENADGVTVEEDQFEVAVVDGSATSGAPEQVISAILGTRQGAAEGGCRLMSIGVTWTDATEVAALQQALAVRDIRGVMLVSPLLAAAVLTQTVGQALDYEYTALLFVEPESSTLAVVETTDGSIVDLHRQRVHCARLSTENIAALAAMVAALDGRESRPQGVFLVGCGVDIAPIKRQLAALVSVPVSAPEEPDTALARGAALASANAPLFASSTAALAYAQDPGTGEVNPLALAPAYLDVSANAQVGSGTLAYSALAGDDDDGRRIHRPFLLAGSGLAAALLVGIVALLSSLASDVGPTVGQRTSPRNAVPTKTVTRPPNAHAPAVAVPEPAAPPAVPPPSAAAPPPPQTVTAPTPVVHQLPQSIVTPAPVHRAPARQAPAYAPPPAAEEAPPPAAPPPPPAAPAPAPQAPAPPPAAPPPAAPGPQMPPMTMYLHLPFVTIPIPINPPPPPPPPPEP
jgi:hypothetical protein